MFGEQLWNRMTPEKRGIRSVLKLKYLHNPDYSRYFEDEKPLGTSLRGFLYPPFLVSG